jgi:hypothetical protein
VLTKTSRAIRRARKSAKKAIREFPSIVGEINANELLIISAQAAQRDIESKAFDDDSFGEDKFTTTPYLEGLSQMSSHQQALVPQRMVQAILEDEAEVSTLRSTLLPPAIRRERLQAALELSTSKLQHEKAILEGEIAGKDGLDWSGELPDVSSPEKHRWRLSRKILTLIIVSGADIGVLWYSLFNVPGFKYLEAFLFTAPAVGIQLVFPHLMGSKLASLSKSPFGSRFDKNTDPAIQTKKVSHRFGLALKRTVLWTMSRARRRVLDLTIFTVLLTSWMIFINAVTVIRMDYIIKMANEKDGLSDIQALALANFSRLTLIGLGLWLIIMVYKENVHATEYSSQQQSIFKLEKRISKIEFLTKSIEARIEVVQSGIEQNKVLWALKPEQYGREDVLARGVYLRNFVNEAGEPIFSKWVLPAEPFKTKAPNEKE